MAPLTEDEEWHIWMNSMITGPKTVTTANTNSDAFNQAIQQHYQTAISNQLNQPVPVFNQEYDAKFDTIPIKVHVVERYDSDMEVMIILGVFTNANDAKEYAKANGGWEYEIHEFTLDSEVPVEAEETN